MLSTIDAQAAAKIVEIAFYATGGVGWSLGARSLIMSVIDWRRGAQRPSVL